MNFVFHRGREFEQTQLGSIPKDWDIVSIRQIADVKGGKRLPKGDTFAEVRTEYPYIRVVDFKNMSIDTYDLKYLKCETHELIKNYTISSEDVYISIAGTIGLAGLIPDELDGANLTENAAKLCHLNNVDKRYLAYVLNSGIVRPQVNSLIGKATQPKLALFRIEQIEIPFAPLPEQQKIAETLHIVDKTIQKIDEIIATTERLKQGLMQQLLTKGIGHKEFKYSDELGSEIPKEWAVVNLEDVIREAKSGFACGKRDENGILQLRMNSIDTEGCIDIEGGVKVPVPKDVDEYLIRPGDLLFNNTNSVNLIGKTAIFRGEFPRCVYSNHLTRIRVNLGKVVPEWVLYVLVRKWQLGVPKAICHRHVHQAGINNQEILGLKIALPPHSEQQKIAKVLSTVDVKLKLERTEKAKLEKTKQGLMDLLLTGRIRIKVN